MAQKPPQMAIIGAGIFVKSEYLPRLAEISELVALKAIWSRSEKSAREAVEIAGKVFEDVECKWGDDGLDEIIRDSSIVAVAVVLPAPIQVDMSLKFLKAGKHVLQEKPAATSISGAESALASYTCLCKTTTSAHKIWAVGEDYRFEPAFEEARKLMSEIGDMMNVQVTIEMPINLTPYVSTSWRHNLSGGFVLDLGVHIIAGLRMLVGCELASVSAMTSHVDTTLPAPDTISSIFQLENGCPGVFVLSVSSKSPQFVWRVVGSQGTVQVERLINVEKTGYQVTQFTNTWEKKCTFYPLVSVTEELKAFLSDVSQAALQKGGKFEAEPRSSYAEGARDIAVLDAMLESGMKQGAFVKVKKI